MYEKIFVKRDDGTYEEPSYSHIDSSTLLCKEETERFFDLQSSETFSCTIDAKSAKQLRKVIIPRGMRNYEILKRDGYLSPENAERT